MCWESRQLLVLLAIAEGFGMESRRWPGWSDGSSGCVWRPLQVCPAISKQAMMFRMPYILCAYTGSCHLKSSTGR